MGLTCSQKLLETFILPDQKEAKTSDPTIIHYSSSGLATLARMMLAFVAVVFLLVPVFLLFLGT